MSQYSGTQYKGASRQRKIEKREEAEARQKAALLAAHPDGNCNCSLKLNHHVPTQDHHVEALLKEIFEDAPLHPWERELMTGKDDLGYDPSLGYSTV